MVAVSWLELAKIDVTPVVLPFHSTWEPEVKLPPSSVIVKAAEPASVLAGDMELRNGPGGTGTLLSWRIHTLRPWVTARRIRDCLRSFKENTATRGSPVPRVVQFAPPFAV